MAAITLAGKYMHARRATTRHNFRRCDKQLPAPWTITGGGNGTRRNANATGPLRRNWIRNSEATGAAVGTPGTLPPHWFHSSGVGTTYAVSAIGTDNGYNDVEIHLSGVATGAGQITIGFEQSAVALAAAGQTWTCAVNVIISAGSTANISSIQLGIDEYSNAPAFLAGHRTGALALGTVTLAGQRQVITATLTNAGCASAIPYIAVNVAAAGNVDITLRIAAPMLENFAFATPYIANANVADTSTTATTNWPRTNLLSWSEDFTKSAWPKVNASVKAATKRGPDGEGCWQYVVEDTANGPHYICQNVTITPGSVYTASVLAKAGERTKLQFFWANSANTVGGNCIFDLVAGTAGAITTYGGASSYTVSITPYASNVYRITISGILDNVTTTGRIRIGLVDSTGLGTYVGAGFGGLYVFGAMVNSGATADDYVRTTTVARTVNFVSDGTFETIGANNPRFEYDADGLGRGLLVTAKTTNRVINADLSAIAVGTNNPASFGAANVSPYGCRVVQEVPPRFGDRVLRHWYDGVNSTNVGNQPNTVLTGFTAGATLVAFMWIWVPSAYAGAANTITVSLEGNVGGNGPAAGLTVNPDLTKRDQWQIVGVQATLTAGQTSTAMVLRVSSGSSPIYSCGWVCTEDTTAMWRDFVATQAAAATKTIETVVCTDLSQLGYNAAGFSVGVAWEHATCADATKFPTPLFFTNNAFTEYVQVFISNTNGVFIKVVSGGVTLTTTQVGSAAANTKHGLAMTIAAGGVNVSIDGSAPVYVQVAVPIASFQRAYLGCFDTTGAQVLNGPISRYIDWNRVVSNDELMVESAVA